MFFLIVSFIVAPYAEHSFFLEAIRKLYFARTTEASIFAKPVSQKYR